MTHSIVCVIISVTYCHKNNHTALHSQFLPPALFCMPQQIDAKVASKSTATSASPCKAKQP